MQDTQDSGREMTCNGSVMIARYVKQHSQAQPQRSRIVLILDWLRSTTTGPNLIEGYLLATPGSNDGAKYSNSHVVWQARAFWRCICPVTGVLCSPTPWLVLF